jgi:DHA1 family chloramphenicol resistance protein-like MFS transporter
MQRVPDISELPATVPRSSRPLLPFAVYLLAAGAFLMGTSEYVIAGLLPEIANDFHLSVSRAGLAITIFAIGIIVGSPTTALLTLRLPRRLALVAALIIFAIGHVVAVLSPNFTLVLVARFLSAMVTGAYWAIASVTASRIAGGAAGSRAIGVVLGGGMIATAVGVPLGSFAGQHIGWRGPFWLLAVLSLLAAVAIARFVPADQPGTLPAPSVRAELRVFRSGRVWLVLAACVGITGGVLSVYSFISPLLTDRTGLPESAIPLALVAFGVAAFIGSILGGRLGGRWPYASALIAAGVSLACSAGLFFFSTQAIPTLALFAILGLAGFLPNPIMFVLILRFSGSSPNLPTALASSMFNVGIAVGTAVAAATLTTGLREAGPPLVGVIGSALIFLPLGTLAILDRPKVRE